MIRAAVIDEHEVFRCGVAAVLRRDASLDVVLEAANGPVPDAADVVVVSPRALRQLSGRRPVVVCWGPCDPPIAWTPGPLIAVVERDAVRTEELLATVRALAAGLRLAGNGGTVSSGAIQLDERRRHVLQLLAQGADTRRISDSLSYSERTVKALISDITAQLSARTRAEAVAKGIRLGII